MIRRAILKAVAIPGYQVPFASREMPMPYGWGTGGVQVTAAIIGPDDVLKVIDQGADDTTNAVSIRAFFAKTAGVATTTRHDEATIIQTRHRVPETPLTAEPDPRLPGADPRAAALPRAARDARRAPCTRSPNTASCTSSSTRTSRATAISRRPTPIRRASPTATSMDPSPIPKFDNPEARRLPGAATVRRRTREAHLRHPALHPRRLARLRGPPVRAHQVRRGVRILRRDRLVPRRGRHRRPGRPDVRLLRHRLLREAAGRRQQGRRANDRAAAHAPRAFASASAPSTPAATFRSRSRRARRWRSSANPAPARRRCST